MESNEKKTIKTPKCPYCESKAYTYEMNYIENESCIVLATCSNCDKGFDLTFECTAITKMEE